MLTRLFRAFLFAGIVSVALGFVNHADSQNSVNAKQPPISRTLSR
jgi:hypothetical protein